MSEIDYSKNKYNPPHIVQPINVLMVCTVISKHMEVSL